MTTHYHLWYVRRGEQLQGPFPETLVCSYIVLGRIRAGDMLSRDNITWHHLDELPELMQSAAALIGAPTGAGDVDAAWQEERTKAVLRWLDDRKSPDPRHAHLASEQEADESERRSGHDRRRVPESVEQHVYRESRAEFEAWSRARKQRLGWVAAVVAAVIGVTLGIATLLQPVHPVKVGLRLQRADCQSAAASNVNWSGCNKEGDLLVGVDLHGAELSGANLSNANLNYADLTQANLLRANLQGAKMQGAKLGHAIWIDGRVCAADSVGTCQ